MPDASDNNAVIRENLIDAGFGVDSIDEIIQMLNVGNRKALDTILVKHRKGLLDKVHLYTQQLDCFDYFTYTLKKQTEVK